MTETFDEVGLLSTVLTEHGPLPEDEILRRLQDSGAADPQAIVDRLLDEISCPALQLMDERWIWLPAVLAGRVFTHRVDEDELAHDLLSVTPDLDPITELCEHAQYQQLADGSPVHTALDWSDRELLAQRGIPPEAVDPLGALVLPPGTLAGLGVTVGDLVGIRLTAAGLVVERVVAPQPPVGVGERLAARVTDEPEFFNTVVWTVCVEDTALFTEPVPPLSEIAVHCGLVCDGDMLAASETDFARWRLERKCESLAHRYEIDEDDAFVVATLITVYDQMALLLADDTGADEATPVSEGYYDAIARVGSELANPLLAELLLEETVGRGGGEPGALGLLAETLEPKVARNARVACRWLRGAALERMGDIESAEREFLAAESMDTQWPLTLLDLARYASDRGDVERGLALYRRAGAGPDHPMVNLLEKHRAQPRSDVGRNEPCWCGSGRKYKKCHLGNEALPLAARVEWLYIKATQHVVTTAWDDVLAEVTYERRLHDPDGVGDRLPMDAVLFEGGAFEDFLEVRGSLLPDDERALAEQWLLVDRSVFEVEQVRYGNSVTLRDLRTGDKQDVPAKEASRHLKSGQLICARVAPDGEANRFLGSLEPVELHERDQLIELLDSDPHPVDLVARLSRRFIPPTLTNTEGDLLAMCEATARVSDPASFVAALDDTYDRVHGEEPPHWVEHVTTHGMERIRATLVLDGDTLRVETNSEERMDRVLAVLEDLDTELTVLDDVRQPVSDVADLAEHSPMGDANALDNPELAAARDQFIRDYETKWLDESIPALDGYTPRQAADDPTRRADLIRLLDSFPAGRPGGMDVDRLRAALDLR